ncbi:glutamate racemase [Cardinium endosymbiont of Tipula unca]|uniref:glutamate racemase n=1 Tax=Cardinium endosymbiont of Tipula unca TaxID=3066216 RepID=UPI0030D4260F
MFLPNHTFKTAPIAIYDSGVGGLSITRRLKELLPNESVHYIADTKNLPYGNKTTTELCSYVKSVVHFCLSKEYKLLVIACNTATAAANLFLASYLKKLNKPINIIDVVDPVVAYIIKKKAHKKIALIGTEYTVSSGIYEKQFKETNTTLFPVATPLLAPMVESLFCAGEIDKTLIKNYLSQLPAQNMDALIPGCTHYVFIEKELKRLLQDHYQKEIEVIDVAWLTALTVEKFLTANGLSNNMTQKFPDCFMATELTPSFTQASKQLFGKIALEIDLDACSKLEDLAFAL